MALARHFFKVAGLPKSTKANFVRGFQTLGLTAGAYVLAVLSEPPPAPPTRSEEETLADRAALEAAARDRQEHDPAARAVAERGEASAKLAAQERAEHERMAREGQARQKADEDKARAEREAAQRGKK